MERGGGGVPNIGRKWSNKGREELDKWPVLEEKKIPQVKVRKVFLHFHLRLSYVIISRDPVSWPDAITWFWLVKKKESAVFNLKMNCKDKMVNMSAIVKVRKNISNFYSCYYFFFQSRLKKLPKEKKKAEEHFLFNIKKYFLSLFGCQLYCYNVNNGKGRIKIYFLDQKVDWQFAFS